MLKSSHKWFASWNWWKQAVSPKALFETPIKTINHHFLNHAAVLKSTFIFYRWNFSWTLTLFSFQYPDLVTSQSCVWVLLSARSLVGSHKEFDVITPDHFADDRKTVRGHNVQCVSRLVNGLRLNLTPLQYDYIKKKIKKKSKSKKRKDLPRTDKNNTKQHWCDNVKREMR